MEGVAWIPDSSQPGVWKTRFYWPFTFDYLVAELDEEYRYVAIAHPSRDYAWIMAREPDMPESDYQNYVQALADQGYDASRILRIAHRPEQAGLAGFQD